AGGRARDRGLVLRKRRRIENNRVEALAEPLEPAQLVEHVTDARVHSNTVARGILVDTRDRIFGDVERDRLGAAPAQPQREASVVAEAVEQAAPRIRCACDAVLALVEEQPGLLAAAQVDVVLDARLADGHTVRNLAGEDVDPLLQSLERAGPR